MRIKFNFSKQEFYKTARAYSWIILGSFIAAAAINVFLVPYKIAPGGVSGVATVLYYLSGGKLPVGFTMLVLNVPLFMAGMRFIGKRFTLRTFFGAVTLSFLIDTTEPVSRYFIENYLVKLEPSPSSPDILLYSIFGGFLMGAGLGIVFKAGATTGGSDLAARIVNHFAPRFTMGQILLFIDTSVIIFAAAAFKSFQLALYAILTLFISSRVIDVVLEGVSFAKALFIISDKSDKIAEKILTDLDRGVTALKGKGMYTGSDKQVLLCVVHRAQIQSLKEIVKGIDERAFIIMTDIREVLGEGFRSYD